MKNLKSIKLKSTTVLGILFATGIALSIAAVYGFSQQPQQVSGVVVYSIIGLTFVIGLYAINVATSNVHQTVVYLDQKKSTESTTTTIKDSDEQLEMEPLQKIVESVKPVSQAMVNAICKQLDAGQAAVYVRNEDVLHLTCGFALSHEDTSKKSYQIGEGLVGRVAKEGSSLYIDSLPKGYIIVFSGLGSASPTYLVIVPLKIDNEVKGVLELALFKPLSPATLLQLETIASRWATVGL